MKKLLLLSASVLLLSGCPSATSTTPPQALAPGYTSQVDQQFGQALAAAHALANQAATDFSRLTPAQQAPERNPLNAFIAAVNAADQLYTAYHVGQASPAQVQAALDRVNSTQAAYTAVATGAK